VHPHEQLCLLLLLLPLLLLLLLPGTLMVKDKSHLLLEDFYAQHTLLTAEQKAETGDWWVCPSCC
jgi:hypothetical protein